MNIIIFIIILLAVIGSLLSGGIASAQTGWNLSNYTGFGLPSGTIAGIIDNLLTWMLGIFAAIGVIGFVISGIMYLTAAGSEDQITKAKSAMKWSLVGVVVGIVGLVILIAVSNLLQANPYF